MEKMHSNPVQTKIDSLADSDEPICTDLIPEGSGDRTEDNDDTPDEEIIAGIKQGMKEALSGQTIPLSEMWVGIDVE